MQREKNQVRRPKHLRVNASPRVENKVSDFVRINIIDKMSAENAVDDRPSKRIPELDSLTLLHVAKDKKNVILEFSEGELDNLRFDSIR